MSTKQKDRNNAQDLKVLKVESTCPFVDLLLSYRTLNEPGAYAVSRLGTDRIRVSHGVVALAANKALEVHEDPDEAWLFEYGVTVTQAKYMADQLQETREIAEEYDVIVVTRSRRCCVENFKEKGYWVPCGGQWAMLAPDGEKDPRGVNRCKVPECLNGPADADDGLCDLCLMKDAVQITEGATGVQHECASCAQVVCAA